MPFTSVQGPCICPESVIKLSEACQSNPRRSDPRNGKPIWQMSGEHCVIKDQSHNCSILPLAQPSPVRLAVRQRNMILWEVKQMSRKTNSSPLNTSTSNLSVFGWDLCLLEGTHQLFSKTESWSQWTLYLQHTSVWYQWKSMKRSCCCSVSSKKKKLKSVR